ncbi:hypothetical protein RHOSPDRAFT_33872 [Rhodotorula sp. JG-1b]|nr:hypothetical protein RHOSPDRAFT_33872 [Rhodotorula sp. JG-1b]
MSTCSFSSYLSARASFIAAAAPATADAPVSASGLTAITAPVPAHSRHHHHPHTTHHLDHVAPSPSLSDAGSPFKRQRNRSPDSTTTTTVVAVAPAASVLPAPESTSIAADDDTSMSASVAAASYFAAFHHHHGPPPSGLAPPTPSSSPLHTPLVAPVPKSILCVPSSPLSTVCSSPFTSPPISRPVSRRSSTSKSVRFARCTNASVFPTHSTEEYDRSPIVPTCESESLEIKRCKAEDEEEGWIMCQARLAAAAAGADKPQVPKLPKHAPTMDNPVEGVHGLIEGGFFVGDERDRLGGSTPTCGAAGLLPEVVPEEDDDEDDLDLNPLEGALNDEDLDVEIDLVNGAGGGERMLVDDAPADLDVVLELDMERRRSISPSGSAASSSSAVSSASSSLVVGPEGDRDDASRTRGRPGHVGRDDSPPSTASTSSNDGDSSNSTATGPASSTELSSTAGSTAGGEAAAAIVDAPKKKRFGLCGLGKYTRQDIFSCHDSLGGF